MATGELQTNRHAPRLSLSRTKFALSASVGIAVALVYTCFSVLQWRSYAVPSWDLGIFTQLARDYAHLQPPIVPIKGQGFNLLGDHFHPILILLGPVYAIFPSAFSLVVLQNLLFGFAAATITWIASTVMRSLALAVGIGLAFGFSWGLQSAVEVQFHEIAFAVPLLALSLGCFLQHRWLGSALWAAPLVFVKEDLGLTVIAMGLLILVKTRTPVGLWLVVWGLGWFAFAIFVVLPSLNPSGHWAYGGSIGMTAAENPLSVFDPQKGVTLWLLALASGFLCLRSPIVLLAIPTIAWRFLSTNSGYFGPTWHYSAVLMPIVFCAAIDGIQRMKLSQSVWVRRSAIAGLATMLIAAVALLPQFALGKLARPVENFSISRSASAEGALDAIPDGVTVESDVGLMNYLVDRTTVFWSGNRNPAADYLVIDHVAGGSPGEWESVIDVARALHPNSKYRTIYSRDGYEVAKKLE